MIYLEKKNLPNHQVYLAALKKMSPEDKLKKVFELSQLGRDLFFTGIKNIYPDLPEEEIRRIYLKRIEKCYNRNY